MRKPRKQRRRSSWIALITPDLRRISFFDYKEYDKHMGRVEREADRWFLVGPATCLRETEKAICVKLADTLGNFWLPKSQLHPEENEVIETGDQGMLVCASWIAKEKGWLKG